MSLLGIDVGSSRCKAAAFTPRGALIAVASRAYGAGEADAARSGMDADEFWRAVCAAAREAAAAAAAAGDRVEALAVSSHGETFIPVDAAGAPSGDVVMNWDNRAVEDAAWWEKTLGRQGLYRLTGVVPHPMYPMAKIRWLQRNAPGVVEAAARFIGPAEYVLTRMGLPAVTDQSLASRWMALDITSRQWSPEILSVAGISAAVLPEVVPAGTAVGRLSAEAATALGVPIGTVVAVGGHDQPTGALGAGATRPGIVSDSAGTYECLSTTSAAPCLGEASFRASLNSYCHVVPGAYVTLAFFPSGIVVDWFLHKLADAEIHRSGAQGRPHEWMEAGAPAGPSGLLITPHIIGSCNPSWNPRATMAVTGLTPAADLYHLYKGILEGIACEFALNASVLQAAVGPFARVRIYGGGGRSLLGVGLRAALSGRSMETLQNPEPVCLGAAILAGVGAGVYRDVHDGASHAVAIASVHPPDPGVALAYEEQARRYAGLFPALEPLFDA